MSPASIGATLFRPTLNAGMPPFNLYSVKRPRDGEYLTQKHLMRGVPRCTTLVAVQETNTDARTQRRSGNSIAMSCRRRGAPSPAWSTRRTRPMPLAGAASGRGLAQGWRHRAGGAAFLSRMSSRTIVLTARSGLARPAIDACKGLRAPFFLFPRTPFEEADGIRWQIDSHQGPSHKDYPKHIMDTFSVTCRKI